MRNLPQDLTADARTELPDDWLLVQPIPLGLAIANEQEEAPVTGCGEGIRHLVTGAIVTRWFEG